ncbi:ubiquitin carboxyl-terminal hydrolase 17-like protein 6 [Sorex fumeus]|uniref:ubiquitin carboxyl-terminal hydrolase 17-like protein 6 n=1 Tax=Sorex fumeus TaxID=62283 RepID=UPI0024AE14AF|nr:ubiquitin carboxyl-terminal hydrolase 17-like protein 6 [Sorex fumeus]
MAQAASWSSKKNAGVCSDALLTEAAPQLWPTTSQVGLALQGQGRAGAKALPPERKTGRAVGAGLRNVGNSCYVNAALQCLTYTPALASWAASGLHRGTHGQRPCCRACGVRKHISRALRSPGEVLTPCPSLLAGFHRQRQEDAHEFLMSTLDAMQQGCPQGGGKRPADIAGIFGGRWRSQVQCLRCLAISDTFEPYLDVALDVGAAPSVAQALRDLVKPERLEGPDAYLCGSCGQKMPATKTLTLHAASRVLMLVLKRFCQDGGAKLAGHVSFPECLDMGGCTSEPHEGHLIYLLYAVLVHTGWTSHGGHYLCYVRAADCQWYQMDDAKVSACDVSHVLSQQAYVLFYTQKAEWDRGGGHGHWAGPEGPGCVSSAIPGDLLGHPACELEPSVFGHPELCEDSPGISLDCWRRLQEQSRPKPPPNLRKTDATLPANAVIIHGSRHGHGAPREQPAPPKAAPETCATAAKRKGRKGQKSQRVLHSLQLPRGPRL